jgi:hypothetical protein
MVTTTNISRLVTGRVEELGADWFFSKKQRDYSEDFVFDTLLSLRGHIIPIKRGGGMFDRKEIESPEERTSRVNKLIDRELDLIGIRAKYKGRAYLREGIYLQIHSDTPLPGSGCGMYTICVYVLGPFRRPFAF